jgi:tetratricopeptide (TPR) repeat protein
MAFASDQSEFRIGLGRLAAGDFPAAVVALRAAVARDPACLPAARALATAYLRQGDDVAARRTLEELTVSAPLCAQAWRLAAQLDWKLRRYDEALETLGRGLARLPHSDLLRHQDSLYRGALGRAEGSPANVTLIDPADPDPLDRVAETPELLDAVLELPVEAADIRMLRELGRKLEALLEIQPRHADRHLALARVQLKLEDRRAAARSVLRALRANPDFARAHLFHAELLADQGHFEPAIQTLKKLIATHRDWPDLHYRLADLRRRQGQHEQARSHLYTALTINPGYPQAQNLLRRCAA